MYTHVPMEKYIFIGYSDDSRGFRSLLLWPINLWFYWRYFWRNDNMKWENDEAKYFQNIEFLKPLSTQERELENQQVEELAYHTKMWMHILNFYHDKLDLWWYLSELQHSLTIYWTVKVWGIFTRKITKNDNEWRIENDREESHKELVGRLKNKEVLRWNWLYKIKIARIFRFKNTKLLWVRKLIWNNVEWL